MNTCLINLSASFKLNPSKSRNRRQSVIIQLKLLSYYPTEFFIAAGLEFKFLYL